MKMKRISAATIQEALATARRELGEDAVLLETKKSTNPKGVIVTFAVDEPEEPLFNDDARFDSPADILPFSPGIARATTARAEINHPAIDLIQQALAYHGLPEGLSNRIMLTLNKISLKPDSLIEVAHTALADALSETIAFKAIATATKIPPERALMLVGPHGAGKTSAIAKLATELTLQKQKVVLVSTDLERMGGTDSLLKLSSILGCPFHVCESRAQLKALLPEHQNKAWVLIDSTGANIYEFTSTKKVHALVSRSLPSTARRFRAISWSLNSSAMRRAHSLAHSRAASVNSRKRTVAPCCLMKYRRWILACKPNYCGPFRNARSTASAAASQ